MASVSAYQQPDDTWAWRFTDGLRTFEVAVDPGYPTAVAAAEGAAQILGPSFQRLATRLATSLAGRPP